MRRSIATLAAIALALSIPAVARAAWSAPQPVTANGYPASLPTCCGELAFASDGRGAALWSTHSQESHTSGSYTGYLLPTRTAGGSWLLHFHRAGWPTAIEPLRLSLARGGGVVLFGTRLRRPGYVDQRSTGLAARFGHLASSGVAIDHTQRLLDSGRFDSPTFAANAAGDAVAAWAVRGKGAGEDRGVYARLRPARERFGKVRKLAGKPSDFSFLTAGVGESGHVAVVWRRRDKIFARVAAPDEPFGKRLLVGAGKGNGRPSAAVGPNGEVVVAWNRPILDKPGPLLAALRGPSGEFGPEITISKTANWGYPVVTAVDLAGRALVGWQTETNAHVTTLGTGAPKTFDLPAGTSQAFELAVSRGGRVAVVATGPAGVIVAIRSRSGAWAPGEQASPALSDGASIAFDPLTGQPNVVYQVQDPGEPSWFLFAVARSP